MLIGLARVIPPTPSTSGESELVDGGGDEPSSNAGGFSPKYPYAPRFSLEAINLTCSGVGPFLGKTNEE